MLPVFVSVDEADRTAATRATYEVPFPLLSDPEAHVHEAFRVVHEVADEERAQLQGFGIEIEQWSRRGHHKIAVPAMFLVDREGVVRWAHVDRDYKRRPSLEQVVEAIAPLTTDAAR